MTNALTTATIRRCKRWGWTAAKFAGDLDRDAVQCTLPHGHDGDCCFVKVS
jgi:hypothetical protein